MIKCVIQIADIHIRTYQRLDEYTILLDRFINQCKDIVSHYSKEEIRVIVCGDIGHSKNNISNEYIVFTSQFIRKLEEIGTVIVIAGNHDLIVNNQTRKDAITGIFETAQFSNTRFLDYELEFSSGCIVDDNLTYAIYSIYNDYVKPQNIKEIKREYSNNKVVGLYHGMIVGSSMYNGSVADSGVSIDTFDECDCVMCGDIHKRQNVGTKNKPIVYSGSLIQQNFGESVSNHGFVIWNMEDLTYQFVDLENEFKLFDIEIKTFDDIDEDKEVLKNR